METILSADVPLLPIPQNYVGRKRIPNPEYPATIHDIRELEIFIDKRMRDFQITSLDDRIQDSLPSEARMLSFNTSIC